MEIDVAYEHIKTAIQSGHSANAYLLIGNVRGDAWTLCEKLLKDFFPDCDLTAHPDIHILAPEKKSRIISVEAIREKIINTLSSTSFSGGWKIGVIQGADRLKKESANAFLKMLEEPPAKTMFFLLSNQPEQLLPTIISRCQRIDLPDAMSQYLAEPYRSQVISILASNNLHGTIARAVAAEKLSVILAELKQKAGEEVANEVDAADGGPGSEKEKDDIEALISARYREYRSEFTATILSWYRDIMVTCAIPKRVSQYDDVVLTPLINSTMRKVIEDRSAKITMSEAFHFVKCVEEFASSLERNISELPLLSLLMDRLTPQSELNK